MLAMNKRKNKIKRKKRRKIKIKIDILSKYVYEIIYMRILMHKFFNLWKYLSYLIQKIIQTSLKNIQIFLLA